MGEEEGSHEARHEGSSSHESHEGHEEEGSHEARHEGSCSNEGHEGHEKEGRNEAPCHEGSSSRSTYEGHEGYEVNVSSDLCSRVHTFERWRHDYVGCVE